MKAKKINQVLKGLYDKNNTTEEEKEAILEACGCVWASKMIEISCQDYDDVEESSLKENRLIKLVEKALDKSIANLDKKQIELLSKIINSNLNHVMKMRLIGEVFDGKNINFINPEGDEWKRYLFK